MTENIFEAASRTKIRFETAKGLLSVEDLWDLPLETKKANAVSLDDIYRAIHSQLKNDDSVSYVNKGTKKDSELELGMEIIKYVIDTKIAEAEAARSKAEIKAKKEKLLRLIDQKKDEALMGASLEELEAELKKVAESL